MGGTLLVSGCPRVSFEYRYRPLPQASLRLALLSRDAVSVSSRRELLSTPFAHGVLRTGGSDRWALVVVDGSEHALPYHHKVPVGYDDVLMIQSQTGAPACVLLRASSSSSSFEIVYLRPKA